MSTRVCSPAGADRQQTSGWRHRRTDNFPLLGSATSLAVELDHPAYDCIYLALAVERGWQFATADERFQRKVREGQSKRFSTIVLSLPEAAAALTNDSP